MHRAATPFVRPARDRLRSLREPPLPRNDENGWLWCKMLVRAGQNGRSPTAPCGHSSQVIPVLHVPPAGDIWQRLLRPLARSWGSVRSEARLNSEKALYCGRGMVLGRQEDREPRRLRVGDERCTPPNGATTLGMLSQSPVNACVVQGEAIQKYRFREPSESGGRVIVGALLGAAYSLRPLNPLRLARTSARHGSERRRAMNAQQAA
jgi:hypothetical protein